MIEDVMALMDVSLSEPYSIYTYRYFLTDFPHLSFMVKADGKYIGGCLNRVAEKKDRKTGNIGMLAILPEYRHFGFGKRLVQHSLDLFKKDGITEVFLETEEKNLAALALYESLGFIRTKYLTAYYTTGENAYRLKIFF
ncbi:putative N-alpha-acetyltransferase 30A [Blattamonas nauphoetae]|uniref:N-alpha-acetyltransferase 30A n=1 Tax=Blattamonas nauphoetae TaxID=2049346 RepID=A0ABQ9YLX3_9EUKA|nr:putative N-alpha-acetyltransferase 30A [Blattamonas nauphoetae]